MLLESVGLNCLVTDSYDFKHCMTHRSLSSSYAPKKNSFGDEPGALFLSKVGILKDTPRKVSPAGISNPALLTLKIYWHLPVPSAL